MAAQPLSAIPIECEPWLVGALAPQPGYLKLVMSDFDLSCAPYTLDQLLAHYGLDTSQPYTQLRLPDPAWRLYVQPPLPPETLHDR